MRGTGLIVLLLALLGVAWLAKERLGAPVAVSVGLPPVAVERGGPALLPANQVANEVAHQVEGLMQQRGSSLEQAEQQGEK